MIAYSQNAFNSAQHNNGDSMVHLYLGASKFNHSCYPNCLLYFERNRAFICTISYNTYFAFTKDRNINKRKSYLREKYNFDCQCKTCRGITTGIAKNLIIEHYKIGDTSPLYQYWIKPALKPNK